MRESAPLFLCDFRSVPQPPLSPPAWVFPVVWLSFAAYLNFGVWLLNR